MKISWIKSKSDTKSFKLPQALGFDVFSLKELEDADNMLNELVQKNYDTIIISSEVASFSEDIIKKYPKSKNVKIVISLTKD